MAATTFGSEAQLRLLPSGNLWVTTAISSWAWSSGTRGTYRWRSTATMVAPLLRHPRWPPSPTGTITRARDGSTPRHARVRRATRGTPGGAAAPTAAAGYFTAPAVRPDWICRWKIAYTTIMGRIAMLSAAKSPAQSAS